MLGFLLLQRQMSRASTGSRFPRENRSKQRSLNSRNGSSPALKADTATRKKPAVSRGLFSFPFENYPFLRLPTLRRETMKTLEYFFGVRVFWPLPVGLPQSDFA